MLVSIALGLAVALTVAALIAWPNQREGDFVLKDYVFASGQTLLEFKLHNTTVGTPHRNTAGEQQRRPTAARLIFRWNRNRGEASEIYLDDHSYIWDEADHADDEAQARRNR